MKKKLGIVLAGLGYYSSDLLAPALQETANCYLAGIVTGDQKKAEIWKAKYNIPDKNVYTYKNFDTIADNPDIDVVYVVLPPSMHPEYTIRAAKAGKHVWCEKPMAITVDECQTMIDACKANNVTLSIGYRCQHEPNTQAYQKIVKEGSLGKVLQIDCAAGYREERIDRSKLKRELGGGVIFDMGVYAIQGSRLGTGMEPIAVKYALIWTERPEIFKNGIGEIMEAQLEYPGGVMAKIKASFFENMNFLRIKCEKGTIEMDPFSSYDGIKGTSPLGEINFPYNTPWQQINQMDMDSLAIMGNKLMLVPGEEGLRDIRIIQAILESAESGKRVVI